MAILRLWSFGQSASDYYCGGDTADEYAGWTMKCIITGNALVDGNMQMYVRLLHDHSAELPRGTDVYVEDQQATNAMLASGLSPLGGGTCLASGLAGLRGDLSRENGGQRSILRNVTRAIVMQVGHILDVVPATRWPIVEISAGDTAEAVRVRDGVPTTVEKPRYRLRRRRRLITRGQRQPAAHCQAFPCPTCGFVGLASPAYERMTKLPAPNWAHPPYCRPFGEPSHEVCACCGYEFGFDDAPGSYMIDALSFSEYRERWIADGCPWFDESAKPAEWDLQTQLRAAGLGT